jgi:hypothetical protein
MWSLDHVAKETIEMKIAGPDRTAIEVPQLNITASESHTACTKFVEPDKVAGSASTRTHSNEPGNEKSKSGDHSLPIRIPFQYPDSDIDEAAYPCKGCGDVSQ